MGLFMILCRVALCDYDFVKSEQIMKWFQCFANFLEMQTVAI